MDQAACCIDTETIFLAALEKQDPGERAAYLDEACGRDGPLRQRLERLLAAHPKATGSFLESPPVEVQPTMGIDPIQEGPGTTIGRFRLLQQIGEGGFGVVYMAEQLEPVRRRVALKIIKPGMDTREVILRFEAERQALALMDHPHIARVLDAGATKSGRPYFVMELVRGIPITDYCDTNHLATRERLELFVAVCQAVQHAHQKGIIHRDVKPTNVLVTLHDGKPVVKVIDFGVAKAIDRRLTERTLFTRFAEMIGTPLYMSPEQAEMSGLDVDTRTDIYSLGVLLYELLTGSTPFDKEQLGEAAYDEIRRIIREEEPPRPSLRVSTLGQTATAISEQRKTEPRKLSAALKGDLDWIVMKALEKDRTRRYDTAKDFADDVQHYLEDRPVEARAPSTLYRLRKLARRYRAAAATLAFIATTLMATTAFSAWMATREHEARKDEQAQREMAEAETERAEDQARKAREAAAEAELCFELIGSVLGIDDGTELPEHDQPITEVLERLGSRLDNSEHLNHRVRTRVGLIIAKALARAGKLDAAATRLQSVGEAIALGGTKGDTDWVESQQHTLAHEWLNLGARGKITEDDELAERAYRMSLKQWDALTKEHPGNALYLQELAFFHVQLGQFLTMCRKFEEAELVCARALELHEQLLSNHGTQLGDAWRKGYYYGVLGQVLRARGRTEESNEAYSDYVSHLQESLRQAESSGDTASQSMIWRCLANAFRLQGRLFEAKDAVSRTLQFEEDRDERNWWEHGQAMILLLEVLGELRDWEGARAAYDRHLDAAGDRAATPDGTMATISWQWADFLDQQGLDEEARSLRATLLAVLEPAAPSGNPLLSPAQDQIARATLISQVHAGKSESEEAARLLEATRQSVTFQDDLFGHLRLFYFFASSHMHDRLGRQEEAIRHARLSRESQVRTLDGRPKVQQDHLIRLLLAAGRPEEAEAELRAVLDELARDVGDDHLLTHYARADLAEFLSERENYSEAEELLLRAHQGLSEESRIPVPQRQRIIRLLVELYEASDKPAEADAWRAKLET